MKVFHFRRGLKLAPTEMYRMAREKGSCLFLSVVYLSLNPTKCSDRISLVSFNPLSTQPSEY